MQLIAAAVVLAVGLKLYAYGQHIARHHDLVDPVTHSRGIMLSGAGIGLIVGAMGMFLGV